MSYDVDRYEKSLDPVAIWNARRVEDMGLLQSRHFSATFPLVLMKILCRG